ncbi:hypothetical protein [Actinotalea subterranea]|uniref:hypothetical protein n=1 Tax=Actinotalea subterranea TaxID=2607497 RepID=UPI0011EDD421|nr:hypothetical protein [Actinotalea subterranea]
MEATHGRAATLARAVALTAPVVTIGVPAHVLGGGARPSAAVLVVLVALLLVPATLLARHRLRPGPTLVWLAATQGLLHATLAAAATGPAPSLTRAAAARASDHAHAHLAPTPGSSSAAWAGDLVAAAEGHAHLGGTPGPMLLAHAAATVVMAVLLAATDRAAVLARHWLRTVLPLLLRAPGVPVARGRQVLAHAAPSGSRTVLLLRASPRRGPPATAVATLATSWRVAAA